MSRQETKEGGWKDTKSTQHNNTNFDRLRKIDARLNEERADVEKLLNIHPLPGSTPRNRAPVSRTNSFQDRLRQAKISSSNAVGNSSTVPTITKGEEDLNSMADIYGKEEVMASPTRSPVARQTSRLTPTSNPMNPSLAPPSPPPVGLGPEATDRYIKVKMQNMTKQLQDGAELKIKMEEQIKDLQKQLNNAREENRNLTKRTQQLELEIRKGNHPKRGSEAITANHDQLVLEELAKAKKDLEAAERLAKQSDTFAKSKDAQLKRAIETITRLKTQLQDAQQQLANGASGDESRIETLEERVKLLEKQRNELYDGFRKQMKLIDVLKRQKLHLEAARLLSFTEEEFMKSLDWDA